MGRDSKKMLLFAIYVASVVIVNVIGTKISQIAGIRVSAGIMFMPLLFCIADIMTECFGKTEAARMANISTAMELLLFAAIMLAIKMPADPAWNMQSEYAGVLGQSLRMSFASFISFFISQRMDILLFSHIRQLTSAKYLFLRNNLSTIVSQFFDTLIFEFAAFWHLNDKFTAAYVFSLVIPYWIFKIVCSVLVTPLCYAGVKWCNSTDKPKGLQ